MKTSRAILFTALLVSGATVFAATPAQRANADIAASSGAPQSVVEKMQRGSSLTFADIQDLARHRVPDDTTLAYLRSMKTSYRLNTEAFDGLRAAGVSDRVVNYLLLAGPLETASARRVYRAAPIRGYGYRPFRATPGFGRFGGFGGHHRSGHRGGRH
ncbi:MAG: hypothetical protein Q7S40_04470 [Opitutaceae bacterium]|nr:hypothetical protein [Opitutaceae bacterium]